MEPFSWSSSTNGSGFQGLGEEILVNSGFQGRARSGLSSYSSLVLDSEKGELVESTVNLQRRKGVSVERNSSALKNHSEAERRRRARINAHLDTLRDLVPGAKKMDKASLLAEVIEQLKELKKNSEEASKGILMPMDVDEVRVEKQEYGLDGAPCLFRASLCCDYQPGILLDLRQALDALHLMIVGAEVATLEGRMKNVLLVAQCKELNHKDAGVCLTASTLDQALRSVLHKFSALDECSFRSTLSNKRRRASFFNSSFSSPSTDLW